MKKLTEDDWKSHFKFASQVIETFTEEQLKEVKRRRIYTLYRSSLSKGREHPGSDLCQLNFKTEPYCGFTTICLDENRAYCKVCDETFYRESVETKWRMTKRGFEKLIKYYWKTQEDCNDWSWAIAVLMESTKWQDKIVELALKFVDGDVQLMMNKSTNSNAEYTFKSTKDDTVEFWLVC
jgi:hypothetical protein